ncbi:phosphotransferase, partial [Mycobacteroides abscessus]
QWKPGIMHGDFHLANMMFRNDGPQLAAIVDWEMSTIGDPLLDLGWMLATWPSETDDASLGGALVQAGGLPTPQELVAHYAERTDRDLGAMDWYTVLACFKLGIILEGTYARACAGKAPVAVGDYLHGLTLQLFKRAVAITG